MMRREIKKLKEQKTSESKSDTHDILKRIEQLEVDLAFMKGQMVVFQDHIDLSRKMSDRAKKRYEPEK